MCLLAHSPAGDFPAAHLADALTNNNDGWGFAYPYDGRVVVYKGLRRAAFWREWGESAATRTGRPVLFHARWATHGRVDHKNCHPFRLDPSRHGELVVAHNGVLSGVPDHERLSDTRVFVRDYLNRLPPGFLDAPGVPELLSLAARGSRLAFLSGTGRVWLVNDHLGERRDGVWYSNDSYLPKPVFTTSPVSRLLTKWEHNRYGTCGAGGVVRATNDLTRDARLRRLTNMSAAEAAGFIGLDPENFDSLFDREITEMVKTEEGRLYANVDSGDAYMNR